MSLEQVIGWKSLAAIESSQSDELHQLVLAAMALASVISSIKGTRLAVLIFLRAIAASRWHHFFQTIMRVKYSKVKRFKMIISESFLEMLT